MNAVTRHAMWILAALPALLLGGWSVQARLAPPPEGRFVSHGEMLREDGEVVTVSHTIQFAERRFHALTRQGDATLESRGRVRRVGRTVHLIIEVGEVGALSPDIDEDTLFNLLYRRSAGASIVLKPLDDCLIARDTREFYCSTDH